MAASVLASPYGAFELRRYPTRKDETLRAWDAADEYLLNAQEWSGLQTGIAAEPDDQVRHLLVNDGFGGLSLALASKLPPAAPVNWSDSWLAHDAARQNLQLNGMSSEQVVFLPSTEIPQGCFDSVWIKIPKNLALLEVQLLQLRGCVSQHTQILLAGMIKSMPARVWQLVESLIGPTQTAPGRKKAKLLSASFDPGIQPPPARYPVEWSVPGGELSLLNHANVFSRDRLDIGARLLLDHLPQTDGAPDVIDLGCGNGVLGLMLAHNNRQVNLQLVDESYMAVASARHNARQLADGAGRVSVLVGDGLGQCADCSADLIVCNPPFHQQQALSDAVALEMFSNAARVLRPGGELWVVGNRHLGYHKVLKRRFKRVQLVASNRKFVVLKTVR